MLVRYPHDLPVIPPDVLDGTPLRALPIRGERQDRRLLIVRMDQIGGGDPAGTGSRQLRLARLHVDVPGVGQLEPDRLDDLLGRHLPRRIRLHHRTPRRPEVPLLHLRQSDPVQRTIELFQSIEMHPRHSPLRLLRRVIDDRLEPLPLLVQIPATPLGLQPRLILRPVDLQRRNHRVVLEIRSDVMRHPLTELHLRIPGLQHHLETGGIRAGRRVGHHHEALAVPVVRHENPLIRRNRLDGALTGNVQLLHVVVTQPLRHILLLPVQSILELVDRRLRQTLKHLLGRRRLIRNDEDRTVRIGLVRQGTPHARRTGNLLEVLEEVIHRVADVEAELPAAVTLPPHGIADRLRRPRTPLVHPRDAGTGHDDDRAVRQLDIRHRPQRIAGQLLVLCVVTGDRRPRHFLDAGLLQQVTVDRTVLRLPAERHIAARLHTPVHRLHDGGTIRTDLHPRPDLLHRRHAGRIIHARQHTLQTCRLIQHVRLGRRLHLLRVILRQLLHPLTTHLRQRLEDLRIIRLDRILDDLIELCSIQVTNHRRRLLPRRLPQIVLLQAL